jgi:hypothetical protein
VVDGASHVISAVPMRDISTYRGETLARWRKPIQIQRQPTRPLRGPIGCTISSSSSSSRSWVQGAIHAIFEARWDIAGHVISINILARPIGGMERKEFAKRWERQSRQSLSDEARRTTTTWRRKQISSCRMCQTSYLEGRWAYKGRKFWMLIL